MPRPGPSVTSGADLQPGSDSLSPSGFTGGGAKPSAGSVGTGEIADGSVAAADLNLSSVATALAGRSEFTGTYGQLVGNNTWTGTQDFSGAQVTGISGASGRPKLPARVVATSNVTVSSPGATVDSVTLANGDRVLLVGQTAPAENGIYVFNGSSSALTRATDANTAPLLVGAWLFVTGGATGAGGGWLLTNTSITLGTTAQTWSQFLSGAAFTSGDRTLADPAAHGLLAWTMPPHEAINNTALTAGVGFLMKVTAEYDAPSTTRTVWLYQATASVGITSGYCAVYNASGTQIGATSADQSATWNAGSGTRQVTVGSFQVVKGATYYIFVMSAGGTTQPALARSSGSGINNLNLTATAARWATNGSSLTTPPASVTLGSNSGSGTAYFAGLS